VLVKFLRATAEYFERLRNGLGVSLSVRLFVTLLYCIQKMQARITTSSLWAAPRTLVIMTKFSAAEYKGSPQTRAWKRGSHLKSSHTATGLSSVKTVADRHRQCCFAYHIKHWWRAS